MPKINVLNTLGEKVSELELNESVFAVEPNMSAMHIAVVSYLANQRQGTQSTKTRSEVSGGGKKPWRQKGTGRARQGSTRSPQWYHGGIALGPKPRSYNFTINKKVKKLAIKSALSSKVLDEALVVLDSFTHKPVADKAGDHALKDSPADSGESDNVRLFNISAGIGFDAAVCQRADSSFLKPVLGMVRMGKLIYISEAVHMILASPMVGMKITCDGKDTYRPRTLFTVVMNTCYEGGGFKFCPDAVNSDSLLDLFGANDLSRMNFFRIFPTAYDGNHLRFKGLFTDRGRSFTISSAVPLWVHTDGEVLCKSSKITIDVFPHKLQLMV